MAGLVAAATSARCAPANDTAVEVAIAEAAVRFGLPPDWIRAVAWAESGGRIGARSNKGAMGLMQLMPGTWRELRAELGLGDDPFAPRDNVIAGSAYLRRLHDAYGSPGFLAAYNAGPGRYERYLAGTMGLPAETVRYVARVSARIANTSGRSAPQAPSWRQSSMFPEGVERPKTDVRLFQSAPAAALLWPRAQP